MNRAGLAIALTLALLAMPISALAQPTSVPEPIVRTTIDPPRVVVGQRTRLRIDALAPNYMTSPPALPDFQVRNAVTRPLPSLNLSEQQGETTYAGVRFEFAIYPQEPGSYAVADQTLTVTYAAEPPKSRAVAIALPRIAFEAFIPDAASGLDPFVAATSFTIEQAIQRSSDELKVGDAVTRTVTIKADGVPAMLLPPVRFAPFDGLALYPGQPSLQDKSDPRTDVLSATRVDQATYMVEKPGDYLLPSIEIRWWNVRDHKIERARVDTVTLHVLDSPAVRSAAPPSGQRAKSHWETFLDLAADHWRLLGLAIVVLGALAWASPRAVRAISSWLRQRRDTYRASEAWSFGRLRAATRHRDANKVYSALLDWIGRFDPIAPNHTIDALKAAARDPALDAQIERVERHLFAAPSDFVDWSPRQLLRRVSIARRHLRRQTCRVGTTPPLSSSLNPTAARAPAYHHRRPVAR